MSTFGDGQGSGLQVLYFNLLGAHNSAVGDLISE